VESAREEWSRPGWKTPKDSVQFMKTLIGRRRPVRIVRIEYDGYPWFNAWTREPDGTIARHSWGVYEHTGWVRVVPRRRPSRTSGSGW